jgi:hypothetical protein
MSQALEVYLVPNERDLKVFGCRRRKLFEEVLLAAEEGLEALDEEFDVEAEGLISHAEALREIFAGKPTREEDCGFLYGHAYEEYCRVVGERLSNRHFSPTRVEWLKAMDEFLEKRGVPLRFQKLLFERFPIPVNTDATPCGGLWEHEEIVGARQPLVAAIAGGAEAKTAAAAGVVLAWLDRAIKAPSSVIVGFYD